MSTVGIIAQEVATVNPKIAIQDTTTPNITFVQSVKQEQKELLRIGPDGFYVRGEKIPVDENEGIVVFKALQRFLVEAELRRPY